MRLKLWQKFILILTIVSVLVSTLNIGVFAMEVAEEEEEEIPQEDVDWWFQSSNYVFATKEGNIYTSFGDVSLYSDAAVLDPSIYQYYFNVDLAALKEAAMSAGPYAIFIILCAVLAEPALEFLQDRIDETPYAIANLMNLIHFELSDLTQAEILSTYGLETFKLSQTAINEITDAYNKFLKQYVSASTFQLQFAEDFLNDVLFTEYPLNNGTYSNKVLSNAGCNYFSGSIAPTYGAWTNWQAIENSNIYTRSTRIKDTSDSRVRFEFYNAITGATVSMISFRGWKSSYRLVPFCYTHTNGLIEFGLGFATAFYSNYYNGYVGALTDWITTEQPLFVNNTGTLLDGLEIVSVIANGTVFDYTDVDGNVISLPFDPFAIVFGNIGKSALVTGGTISLPFTDTTELTFPGTIYVPDDTIAYPETDVTTGTDIIVGDISTPATPPDYNPPSDVTTGDKQGITDFFTTLFDGNILKLFGWLPDSFQTIIANSLGVLSVFILVLLLIKLIPVW